jgi:FKBP12-rapamycin complex-associated protein
MLISEDNYLSAESFNSMQTDSLMQTVFFETFWKKPNSRIKINCPQIAYGFIKSLWRNEEKKQAFEEMKQFNDKLFKWCQDLNSNEIKFNESVKLSDVELLKLTSKSFYKLGHWQNSINEIYPDLAVDDRNILNYFKQATLMNPNEYKVWNAFALKNYKIIFFSEKHQTNSNSESEVSGDYQSTRVSVKLVEYAISAIKGFFKSISLSHGSSLQGMCIYINYNF